VEVIGSNPIAPTMNQLEWQELPPTACPQTRPLLFADYLSVDVHRGPNVSMPQQFLLYLQIHAKLTKRG
jgi:hypothetical protein